VEDRGSKHNHDGITFLGPRAQPHIRDANCRKPHIVSQRGGVDALSRQGCEAGIEFRGHVMVTVVGGEKVDRSLMLGVLVM